VLLRELAQDDEGVPFAVELRLPHWLRQARDAHAVQELARHVHDYRRVRINGDFHAWMKGNSAALLERLSGGLSRSLAAALADPNCGVNGVLALIGALDERVETLESTLQTQRVIAEGERGRLELDLQEQEETLRRATASSVPGPARWLFRGRAIGAARGRYIEAAERYLALALEHLLAETGLALVARLRRDLADQAQKLDALRIRLMTAHRHLTEEVDAFIGAIQQGTVGRICLADQEYNRALYEQHAPAPQEAYAELMASSLPREGRAGEGAQPVEWIDSGADELIRWLHVGLERFFRPIADMTVEDALRARASETSPQAYRERLFRLAAPSWNLDVTRLQDGGSQLRAIQVMGVPDEGNTVFTDDMPTMVSTHDSTTVTAFLATIGAPYTALQQYTSYEQQYKAARRSRPLHVLPQFQVEDERARLAFALAAVFGMIFSRGFYYYYRPEDTLDSPLKLGNGLANSIRTFAQADTLTPEAMGRVERRIEEIGTMEALSVLTEYYSRDGSGDDGTAMDELIADLRKRVRAYASELQQTQQVVGGE